MKSNNNDKVISTVESMKQYKTEILGVLELTQLTINDATGAYTLDNTFTVGENGTGHDVKFFGDTAGAYTLWDQSVDSLLLVGGAKLNAQGTVTVGVDDTGYDVIFYGDTTGKKLTWDASSDMLDIDGIMKVHNRPVSTDTYALEVKCDYDQASGTGQGALQVSTRVYPDGDTTTINAQGGYSQIQLHSADAMTGGGMVGFLAQAQNDSGTLNGSGITVFGLRSSIADGGTWTSVERVASMHVYSTLSQTVSSGIYNLLFIENNGTTTAADAIAIDGNDEVTALMTLTNVDGAAMVANGSVLADISGTANDGYIKVIVEGETKYIALYDIKTS